jgi:large subunit ribosomal protein L17
MRHLKAGRRLNRNASHRLALMRNLALALFRHERIVTTVAKAKAARGFVERLITLAKRNTLHARRLVLARLGPPSKAEVKPDDDPKKADTRTILNKLFNEIAPRFADRPGGYTRVIKRHERRLGDAGETAFLELLKEGERKVQKRAPAPAPAPKVTPEPPIPTPAPTEEPKAESTPPIEEPKTETPAAEPKTETPAAEAPKPEPPTS